jgi:hypothetical protein
MDLKRRIEKLEVQTKNRCPHCGQAISEQAGGLGGEDLRERARELYAKACQRLGSEDEAKEWISNYPELARHID